jgi:hypothetical protein
MEIDEKAKQRFFELTLKCMEEGDFERRILSELIFERGLKDGLIQYIQASKANPAAYYKYDGSKKIKRSKKK